MSAAVKPAQESVLCVFFSGNLNNRYNTTRKNGSSVNGRLKLPPPDGVGKPLGNHAAANLNGYYKIKLRDLGYRVVYGLVREGNVMKVIVISIRDDDAVYREAERRIANLTK